MISILLLLVAEGSFAAHVYKRGYGGNTVDEIFNAIQNEIPNDILDGNIDQIDSNSISNEIPNEVLDGSVDQIDSNSISNEIPNDVSDVNSDQFDTNAIPNDDSYEAYAMNETFNSTTIEEVDDGCYSLFTCPRSEPAPPPRGSLKRGFFITSGYFKKNCRYMKELLWNCYLPGDYSDCDYITEAVKQIWMTYYAVCVGEGRSNILSLLGCANKYDVQVQFIRYYLVFTSALETLHVLPALPESDRDRVACWAYDNLRSDTRSVVRQYCKSDIIAYTSVFDSLMRFHASKYGCNNDNSY